jgi:REP element-mobilizing transposase RayT
MFSFKEAERKGRRLPGYDYGQPGKYFITIVTQDREYRFGAGVDVSVDPSKTAVVKLSKFGQMVDECWRSIPNKFPYVRLDNFIVMPNHIHGIIEIMDSPRVESGSTGTSTLRRIFHP